jgi:hypothetical protein
MHHVPVYEEGETLVETNKDVDDWNGVSRRCRMIRVLGRTFHDIWRHLCTYQTE